MAATLTDELTRVSVADIEKWDEADGTVYVYGRCTTPEVDTDDQVVDSGWSGPALKEYLATAPTVRVQHNPQRDPAGSAVRVDVNRDGDGAHWLKAAVDEPVAQRLVKKGHLRAFSVGIARPVIERDVSGKARGGVIKGGKIVEVSLVDSPANRSCFLEIAKSAADGTAEFTGKLFGDGDAIQKALGADLTKGGGTDPFTGTSADMSRFGFPEDLSVTFTPDDMARLMQAKFVEKHYSELAAKAVTDAEFAVYKRDIDTATRRRLAGQGHALADGSYPIENTGDLDNAAHLARTGHGNAEGAKRLIARRARELGVANPLDDDDSTSKGTVTDTAAKSDAPEEQETATPDVTKEPKPKPVKKAKKKPKKLPPWLNKPSDGDGKGGSDDGDADDAAKSCKQDHVHTEKCKTTPAQAAGLSGTHDMNPAPVPDLLESPPMASTKAAATPAAASDADEAAPMDPAPSGDLEDTPPPASAKGGAVPPVGMMQSSPEVAAILRFKAAGIDTELGRLHDLTCPAYHPEDVAKCHPFADLRNVDEGYFQRKAVEAACGPSLDLAKSLQLAWQAARVLRETDPAVLNDYRMEAHKAFRDANPGPTTFPTPGAMSPQRFNRPLVTDGHAATSSGYSGPNTAPQVATSAPSAGNFDRPPLSAGQQSPSPSFMKASFEYPQQAGQPVQLNYAQLEKDRARMALVEMHSHLSRQFPEVCPMDRPGDRPLRGVQPENHPVPPIAGIGKGAIASGGVIPAAGDTVPAHLDNGYVVPAPAVAALKAPAEDEGQFMDADVYKGFKKQRKKLGRKVLSGKMTVDEARSRLGRQFAQKGDGEPQEAVQKGVTLPPEELARLAEIVRKGVSTPGEVRAAPLPALPVAAALDPEVIKAAVAEATSELKDLLVKQQQDMAAQQETFTAKLAEQQRVIDAIADQPDPSTAAFSGLAFNPVRTKAARPAGVLSQAEIAERTQQMMIRHLQDKYNASSDPAEREAYYGTLSKMRGVST